MGEPLTLDRPLMVVLSVCVGMLMMPLLFAVAWISKDFHVASPLLDVIGEALFPFNLFLAFSWAFVALATAREAANRWRMGTLGFLSVAAFTPVLLFLLCWIPFLVPGPRPVGFLSPEAGEPLGFYAGLAVELAIVATGGLVAAALYLLKVRGLAR